MFEKLDPTSKLSLRQRLTCLLFFSYTYYPIRRYYINRYCNFESNNLTSNPSSYECSQPDNAKFKYKGFEKINGRIGSKCFPRLNIFLDLYFVVSTATHLYGFLESFVLILVYESVLPVDISWNCYLIGRISIHPKATRETPYFTLITGFLHLVWRYFNFYVSEEYRFDSVLFLFEDENRIKDYIKSIRNGKLSYKSGSKSYTIDHLFRSMFRETGSYINGDLTFHLRPNRTVESRNNLIHLVKDLLTWIFIIATSMILLGLPSILNTSLFDIGYIENYPGCDPHIEQTLVSKQRSRWSVSLFMLNHRTVCMVPDVLLNFFVFFDDVVALLIPASLALFLTYDLMLYWKHIAEKLKCALTHAINSTQSDHKYGFQRNKLWTARASQLLLTQFPDVYDKKADKIYHLQQEMVDFFSQLHHYDRYVAVLVTCLFIIWTVMFVATNYISIRSNEVEVQTLLRVAQVYGCITLTTPIYKLLTLRAATRKQYTVLMSIMAHEQILDEFLEMCCFVSLVHDCD